MTIMEFSDLGKSCAKCNYQDYLPFCCPNCKQWYCSDHRLIDAHDCKSKPATNMTKVDKSKSELPINDAVMYRCSYNGCKVKSLFEFICSECKKNHCINHRLHMVHAPTDQQPKSIHIKQPSVQPSISQTQTSNKPKTRKQNKKCVIL